MSAQWLNGLVFGALGWGVLSGCGEPFDTNCKITRTCRADGLGAGEAGEGGGDTGKGGAASQRAESSGGASDEAGAAGAAETVACASSEDCDDGLFCNGIERCVLQVCQRGAPACKNPDATSCSVTCSEEVAGPSCTVAAKDADEDGQGSALCAPAPGDDCDDTRATVFKGAPELCDHLDNDCDDLSDLHDGLELSGSSQTLGDPQSDSLWSGDVAWLEEKQVFGVVFRDDFTSAGALLFTAIAADGEVKVAPKLINSQHPLEPHNPAALHTRPRIAAGDGVFGVTWGEVGAVAFRQVSAAGALPAAVRTFPTTGSSLRPDIAYFAPTKTWGVAWSNHVVTITTNGTASGVKSVGADTLVMVHIAALAEDFVVTRGGANGTTNGNTVLLAPDLSNPRQLLLEGTAPAFPVVAAAEQHFAVVTSPVGAPAGAQPSLVGYDADGIKTCGPVDVGVAGLRVADVIPTERGYLLTFDFRRGLQEVSLDCQVGPLLIEDTGVDTNYDTALAGGGSGGLLLSSYDPQTGYVQYRQFGNNYCD